LGSEPDFIEATLARRHLRNGTLLLYDVTSTYLEGRCCELPRYGHSRDHRRDRPQLVIGLLCAADSCPVAVEVFEGNTADPMTLSAQIDKLPAGTLQPAGGNDLAPHPAAFDHAPAGFLQRGVDQFGAGLGFVHRTLNPDGGNRLLAARPGAWALS
jgi:hypothetical protein